MLEQRRDAGPGRGAPPPSWGSASGSGGHPGTASLWSSGGCSACRYDFFPKLELSLTYPLGFNRTGGGNRSPGRAQPHPRRSEPLPVGASREKFSLTERGGSRGCPPMAPAGRGRGSLPRTVGTPFPSRPPHGAREGVWEQVCGLAEAKIPICRLRAVPSGHSRERSRARRCPGLGSPSGAGVQRVPQGWGSLAEAARGAELNPWQPKGRRRKGDFEVVPQSVRRERSSRLVRTRLPFIV